MRFLRQHVTDSAIEDAITEIIADRFEFVQWLNTLGTIEAAVEELYPLLGICKSSTKESLQGECISTLEGHLGYLRAVLKGAKASGKKTDLNLAFAIEGFLV